MTKLEGLTAEAERLTIDKLSNKCLEFLLAGQDVRLEKGMLEDEWYEIKDACADFVTPHDENTVKTIIKESTEEMEASFNFIKEELDPDFGKDCKEFNSLMKTVIFHHILTDLHYNAHNIFWKSTELMIDKLKNNYKSEELENEEFIIEEIKRTGLGYPLLICGNDIRDNPNVVKIAIEKNEWVFDYASKRLKEMAINTSIGEALESDILRMKLNKELPLEKTKKRSLKL